MQYVSSLYHNPFRQTVSKACLKSIKAQYFFFLLDFIMSIKLLITNKLSVVE